MDDSCDNSETPIGAGAKRLAHERALKRNLQDYFNTGERIELFVETPPDRNGGGKAVATINRPPVYDARVFISPGQHPLHRGDRIRCRIKSVEDNHLEALALYRLD